MSKATETLLTICAAVMLHGQAGAATFELLAPPPELTTMGQVNDVSTDGAFLAGHALRIADWTQVGFTWSQTDDMTAIPVLAEPSELQAAEGISADGRVIAGWQHLTDRTAICIVDGAQTSLPNPTLGSVAKDVNPEGTRAVGAYPPSNQSTDLQATIWATSTGNRTVLGDLTGGAVEATALAISADGGTVVGWGTSASGREAFRHAEGTLSPLGDLAGGQFFSEAASVSSNGAVIVGRSVSTNGMEAFRWTAGDGMVGLGDLPGGAFLSEATGVSDDGVVIVGDSDCEAGPEIFVYDTTHGLRSFRSILEGAGIDVTGWSFTDSRPALSGDGDVLAGRAIDPNLDVVLFRFTGLREALASLSQPVCTAFLSDHAGTLRLRFTAEAGLFYRVECSDDLAPGTSWDPVGEPVLGNGTEVDFACSGTEFPDARYYRLVAYHNGL